MASNMYRVGDYIYVETSPLAPYQIRRIEELNKNQNGSTEAKVVCFFRRKDIPPQLQALADRHQGVSDEDQNKEEATVVKPPSPASVNLNLNPKTPEGSAGEEPVTSNENEKRKDAVPEENEANDKTKAQLKQRELFLSRQIETLPTTSIRGKCTVTLLNETEAPSSYLEREDAFFYTLVYDPQQKTLLADRGEIRVGSRYQVDPMPVFKEEETDTRDAKDLETLVWTTDNSLIDVQIDQFLVVARSVGTFARALDCSSSVKQPSLHMSAAAASRDITLFQAMDMLHQNGYDLGKAMSSLVPTTGPVLCRDQMEEWSASEANLFEEAMEKYGKDFNEIRQEFLPWKTMSSLIEYYYLWKTTDRYVQQKRVKAVEAESKLKQIYVPNYTKPHPAVIAPTIPPLSKNGTAALEISVGKPCESCSGTTSTQWYAWSNPQATGTSGQGRLCQTCWSYWKKYGDLQNAVHSAVSVSCPDDDVKVLAQAPEALTSRPHRCSVQNCGKEFKLKSHLLRHCATAHGLPLPPGSPRPMMKTRTAFYLAVSPTTRLARKLCSSLLRPRHAARFPFLPINSAAIRQELQVKLARRTPKEVQTLVSRLSQRSGNQYQRRIKVSDLTTRIAKGQIPATPPAWVVLPDKSIPKAKPERVAFPKPPKAPDGSLIYERVPNAPFTEKVKRRPEEQLDGPAAKKPARDSPSVGPAATPPLIGIPAMAGLPLNVSSVSPSPSTTSPYLPTFSAMPGMTGVQSITPMPMIPGLIPPSLRPTLPLNIAPDMYGLPLTASPAAKVASPLAAVSPSVKQAPLAATPAGPVKLGSRPQGHGPSGRVKQLPTWMDAPDDLYFNANQATKKHRRQLSTQELRRAARKPWRPLKVSN